MLRAVGIQHLVTEQPDGCHVLVPEASAPQAAEQLRLYRGENPPRRIVRWPSHPPSRGLVATAAWTAVLAMAYVMQVRYAQGVDWADLGQLIAGAVTRGEWWRAVTSLMLHADLAHVAGNIVFGGFFGYLAGQYLGSGIALLAILLAGAGGNLANAGIQIAAHRSVGASTAVFAALGIVASCVWSVSRRFELSWARRWSPVVGAVALLAFTGTGDERTDIMAHLFGFLAGVVTGWLLYRLPGIERPPQVVQQVCAALSGLIIVCCWWLALR